MESTGKGAGSTGSLIQCLIGVEKLDDLMTYKHKVWLVTSFQLHLDVLNFFQRDKHLLHLRVVCSPNFPRRNLVSYGGYWDSHEDLVMDVFNNVIKYAPDIADDYFKD